MTARWVVDRSVEAAAIAESARYTSGVDIDAALNGFDGACVAVLEVNANHPEAAGVERVDLIRQAIEEQQ